MHFLKSIRVDGYLGHHKALGIDFTKHPVFIIGRNGTGKTTLINFINACLDADWKVLRETQFSCVELKFKEKRSRRLSIVIIQKKESQDYGSFIEYRVKQSSQAEAEIFLIPSPQRRIISSVSGKMRRALEPSSSFELRRRLGQIYSTSWLSLHRYQDQPDHDEGFFIEDTIKFEDNSFLSGVDKKLAATLNHLSRYFTRLDRKVSEKTLEFQRDWFVSFLADDRKIDEIINAEYDMSKEKQAISSIFESFQMPPERYKSRLAKHTKLAEEAALENREKGLSVSNFFVMYDVYRLHQLVKKWQVLQEHKEEIYNPRSEFVKVTSGMLYRKNVCIDSSNEVSVYTEGGSERKIFNQNLSSGEKQLLIFLSEALLQERQPYIFLADEPELSLHVEWQEELVPSLRRMNPNAQIIFATHSPDVVGGYRDNIFDMETFLS